MFYLHRVKPSNWTQDRAKRDEAAQELVAGGKLSIYLCSTDDETNETAVALGNGRKYLDHFDYIRITEADLQAAGVAYEKTDGKTGFPPVDDRHFELRAALTIEQALTIYDRVQERDGQRQRLRSKDLLAHARRLYADKQWHLTATWFTPPT